MESISIVRSTGVPAFATDVNGSIVAWNVSAERLFGCSASRALHCPCWEVLAGRDVFGNRYCGPHCPIINMILRGEAVNRCELTFRNWTGEEVPVGVALFAVPGASLSARNIVHLLSRIDTGSGALVSQHAYRPSGQPSTSLTRREIEVLDVLATGKGTVGLAADLGVSVATVRNHIDHVFRKLQVHNRMEAVSVARRRGLIRR